jgi:hypothetical protein
VADELAADEIVTDRSNFYLFGEPGATFSDLTVRFSEIASGIIKAPLITACSMLLPFGDTLT